jgi:hypothetical protein
MVFIVFLSLAKQLGAVRDYGDLNPPLGFSGILDRGTVQSDIK